MGRPAKDRTGTRTGLHGEGKITLTSPAPSIGGVSYWKGLCSCGRELTIATSNLAKTLSCGCSRVDGLTTYEWADVAMHHFGLLLPLRFSGGAWECACTGCSSWIINPTIVRARTADLRKGRKHACPACEPAHYTQAARTDVSLMPFVLQQSTRDAFYSMHYRAEHVYEGVRVCARWAKTREGRANFFADVGVKQYEWQSLDRIDPHGNYEPTNCRWSSRWVQDRNKRGSRTFTFRGEVVNLVDYAAKLGKKTNLVSKRLNRWNDRGLSDSEGAELLWAECPHRVQSVQEIRPN